MNGSDFSSDTPALSARHLLICREVTYNPANPGAPYGLHGLLTVLRPMGAYPLIWAEPVVLFAQYQGGLGEYEVWFDLVRVVYDEEGELADEIDETSYDPFGLNMLPGWFVQSRAYHLRRVPFSEPGLYEFRLRIAGIPHTLVTEQLFVEN